VTSTESAEIAGTRWELVPEFRASLEGPVTRLLAGRPPPEAERLKHTRVREVWRVDATDGVPFYVKRYLSPNAAIGLRARLRGSKARREAATARALEARGIDTVHPLAVGDRRGPGLRLESVLVTEAIAHRGDLIERLGDRSCAGPERRRLLSRLGRYLARLHDAGIDPPDLHGENLLLRATPEEPFVLIDVDGVVLGEPLPRARRENSLARTLHSLRDVTQRTDRARALRAYLDANGAPAHERPRWREAVDREWERERRRVLRSGTRRAIRIGSRFDQERSAARNLYWRRSVGREIVDRALEAHAETIRTGQGHFLKRSVRVRITLQEVDGAKSRFVVKEIFETSLWARLRNTLMGSRSRRAWIGGHGLDIRGFATPQTVALEEHKRGGLVAENLLITVALDGWVPLSDYFREHYAKRQLTWGEIRAKRALLRLLGRTLQRLHEEGIHHHDLSARNLFVEATSHPREVAILDLESLRRFPPLTRARRATHLAQVLETVGDEHWSDAVRLLHAYGIRSSRERRRWLRRIERRTRRRVQRRRIRRARRARRADSGPAVPS
jgi:tRNA A-37 threonylcarbamoyl transferase component Bud32